jgi:hypothetical protein
VIELNFERDTGKILCGKRERGFGQIDAVIVPDLGTGERRPHLAGIAAGNIEKGEGPRQRGKRAMQDRARFAMRNRVAIDQFLIGRPLLLKLLERDFVGDSAFGVEAMDVDFHIPDKLIAMRSPTADGVLQRLAVSPET